MKSSWHAMDSLTLASNRTVHAYRSHKASEALYVIAGTHGDEVESVLLMNRLWQNLNATELKHPVVLVPNLNPDGLVAQTRVNGGGVDLNRNYPASNWEASYTKPRYFPGTRPLDAPENQFLERCFSTVCPTAVISLHSWKPFIQVDSPALSGWAHYLGKQSGYPVIVGNIDGHATPGSLSSWMPSAYDADVLTVELPEIGCGLSVESIISGCYAGLRSLVSDPLAISMR